MFLVILGVVLAGAGVHAMLGGDRSRERVGELVLRWVLVGYCGVPMVVVGVMVILDPVVTVERFGLEGTPSLAAFFGWAYLGMAVAASLAVVYRDAYLVGPALTWAIFFVGATMIHLGEGHAGSSHAVALSLLATHGLISVILLASLVVSRAWRPVSPRAPGPTP